MVGRWVFVASFAALVTSVIPLTSDAQCGGLCLYEVGSPDNALSGAGASARAADAATALFNVAGTTRLKGAHVMTATVLAFADQEFNVNGKTVPADAGNSGGQLGGFAPLGSAFISSQIWDELRFALSFASLYGGGLNYDNDWVGRTSITDSSLLGLTLAPGFAYPVLKDTQFGTLSIGAAVNVMYLNLNYQSKANLSDVSPTLEIKDADDWTVAGTVAL